MSRSYRKNPISSISNGKSEKDDKRRCNRILRRCTKQLIGQWAEVDEDFILPTTNEAFDVAWQGAKDGKHWWGEYASYAKNRPIWRNQPSYRDYYKNVIGK
jgi:hypothetical protein